MTSFVLYLRKNRTLLITASVLLLLLLLAIQGMETQDWVVTVLRSLSVAAVTFLVASGFSLIFGLLDVLNLAQGTLFMIGAYVAWTVYIRPDTFIDILTPFCFLIAGFTLLPLWDFLASRLTGKKILVRLWPWVGLLLAGFVLLFALRAYPITIWNPGVYSQSPGTYSLFADTGTRLIPPAETFGDGSAVLVLGGILLGSFLLAFSLAGLQNNRNAARVRKSLRLPWAYSVAFLAVFLVGLLVHLFNTPLTTAIVGLGSTWLFFIAILVALLTGVLLGSLIESTLIRPLYSRPIYQLMITLGLSAVGIELVRAIWGRPEFTMPKPEIFNGAGVNCPATTLAGVFQDHCSTILFMDSRIRVYNEIFIPLVGLIVLIGIWLLLQRTRIGMIIRAGVQDREMVEALGINVRRVFTFVFALGVGMATLGGALAGPSMGISTAMGESLLLNALIALAIGGLTSFPGAAVGSLLVGLMQQFIIKYGQIGIQLPFLAEPFKPTPPLVPASTVLLMVIILLVMPRGLLGRKE
ncbi:MAG: branched-chain amino acid ABC transporter permease [Chloroflexi bacterium]|nr:branched-chain amino acid ABC transporter permease [Chloroflexota bacterium]